MVQMNGNNVKYKYIKNTLNFIIWEISNVRNIKLNPDHFDIIIIIF